MYTCPFCLFSALCSYALTDSSIWPPFVLSNPCVNPKNDRRDQPIVLGMSHAIRDLASYLPERNPEIYFLTTLYINLNLEGHMSY